MKPKEVTDLLGINRDRIKYFREQGVFSPELPANGQKSQEYTERDVEKLKQIIVLTKASLTCGDIKKVQDGTWTLEQAFTERRRLIEEEMQRMKGSLKLSSEMIDAAITLESMPTQYYWDEICRREADGEEFMDYLDTRQDLLIRPISCPYCGSCYDVDLAEFVWDETATESQRYDDMGSDVMYMVDSGEEYQCPNCRRPFRIIGWVREYPIGAYDSDGIEEREIEEDV